MQQHLDNSMAIECFKFIFNEFKIDFGYLLKPQKKNVY